MRNRECIKKFAETKGLNFGTGSTFVVFVTIDGSSRTFHDSGKWEKKRGSTVVDEGTWECDGADNYFVWIENKRYSSRTNSSVIMNTIFNCVKEDLESRGMKFEFESGKLKVIFRTENYYIFYEDGKWESFDKAQNKVFPGTWECDGEDSYNIFTEWQNYSSKTNQWK